MRARRTIAATVAAGLAISGCGGSGHKATISNASSGSPASEVYNPTIDPAQFSTVIDNPNLPFVPGTRLIYEGTTADGHERTVVEVTRDTKKVMGVDTVVVHDTVYLDAKLEEETFDWYAQDKAGNVWYFGEATKKGDSTKGSFEAGVDGALPGIIMEGHPKVGDTYRQEYYKGVAEDRAEVLSVTETATVAAGSYRDLVMTKDYNPLEPSAPIEHKYFAAGVGQVLVVHVTGPAERVELTKVEQF